MLLRARLRNTFKNKWIVMSTIKSTDEIKIASALSDKYN
jgi:hypothetical protein